MARRINEEEIIGRRFGQLVVLSRDGTAVGSSRKWMCKCDCGVEKSIYHKHLQGGVTISCGCFIPARALARKTRKKEESQAHELSRFKNLELAGMTFGRWTAIERLEASSIPAWECLCSCGKTGIVGVGALLSGRSKSCGCLSSELTAKRFRKLDAYDACVLAHYKDYKRKAKSRGLEFSISVEEFLLLATSNCRYCGAKPSRTQFFSNDTGGYIANGIDRIDNKRGYVAENVVPCCGVCNKAKGTMSDLDFICMSRSISSYTHSVFVLDHSYYRGSRFLGVGGVYA